MKYCLIVLLAFLCSCENNVPGVPGRLLSQQKIIEDSISLTDAYETYYMQRALDHGHDSLAVKKYVDSSLFYLGQSQALKQKLRPLQYSIDSLTKLK